MNKKDLRLTILGCFRYSLGRKTYMPSHTVEVIKENKKIFREHDWKSFIKEIDECSNLGMKCDVETWDELKEFSGNQLKNYDELQKIVSEKLEKIKDEGNKKT